MAIENINVGTSPNDGNGDPIRDAFIKCNDNFDELETTKISGSGTDNYVPKFNGTDAIENSQIFDDGTNVGIGTTSPLGILHLYKSSATTRMLLDGDAGQSKIITYRTNGLQRFGLYVNNTAESGSNAGSDFQIRAYNDAGSLLSTPLFIKRSTGNVGIGTTSPSEKLVVGGSSGGSTTPTAIRLDDTYRSGSDAFDKLKFYLYKSSTETYGFGLGNLGDIQYWAGTNSTGTHRFFTSQTERLRITSSGNVGIGTTAPDTLFHISSLNSSIIRLESTNTALGLDAIVGEIQFEANDASGSGTGVKAKIGAYSDIASGNAIGLRFFTSEAGITTGTEKMRITSGGNVGIGTTSPNASAILHLRSTSQGFLPPTMTTSERDSIGGPVNGLVIYNTDSETIDVFTTGGGWKSLSY